MIEKKKKFPSSIRKYIRNQKARIRREFFAESERNKRISELVTNLAKKYNVKYININDGRNIQKPEQGENEIEKSS